MDNHVMIMRKVFLMITLLPFVASICRDHNRSCKAWATRRGYCTQGSFIRYMRRNCPLSCGLCADPPSSNCRDVHNSCARWKRSDQCEKNPGFMLKMCKWSCGKCGGNKITTSVTTTTVKTTTTPTTTTTTPTTTILTSSPTTTTFVYTRKII